MSHWKPADSAFAERVRTDFARQAVMATLGVTIERVAAGEVDLVLPFNEAYAQQHGFLHAGIISTALDSACGYAAYSLMPAGAEVLTVEFKINLLAPAKGDRFRFLGRIVKAGRTLTLADGQAVAIQAGRERLVATMTGTLMTLVDRPDLRG